LSLVGSAYTVSVLIKELRLWCVNQRLVGGGVHRWWWWWWWRRPRADLPECSVSPLSLPTSVSLLSSHTQSLGQLEETCCNYPR
jgi:hypothetical protein